VIGRSKDCDIQVNDPNVSRRHAEVRRAGDSYVLVDLDSTNGVEVNGKRVNGVDLSDGSRFTIGSTEIVFSEDVT
jgi:pSer/pThr/pTyr-binding forkhead associated (FHA) protein